MFRRVGHCRWGSFMADLPLRFGSRSLYVRQFYVMDEEGSLSTDERYLVDHRVAEYIHDGLHYELNEFHEKYTSEGQNWLIMPIHVEAYGRSHLPNGFSVLHHEDRSQDITLACQDIKADLLAHFGQVCVCVCVCV